MEQENVHTAERLKELQALPLERKVEITKSRIIEWYTHYEGKVYISFSGGKDSTVLLHLVRSIFPDVESVYVDTGLEYPEIKEFVKSFDNVTVIRPKLSFKQVLEKYGYPLITKEVARDVGRVQSNGGINTRTGELTTSYKMLHDMLPEKNGVRNPYNKSKWEFLVHAPFKISNQCCYVMKKYPGHKYQKDTGKMPYLGNMASESLARKSTWLQHGCNAFNNNTPQSTPMAFWTEQDVLQYCLNNKIQLCSVYGDIVKDEKGRLRTTSCDRTGCVFCGFGANLEKSPNRFERLKETHTKLWDYCMKPIESGGLGMAEVLDYINVPWGRDEEHNYGKNVKDNDKDDTIVNDMK